MKSQSETACLVFTAPHSHRGLPSGYLRLPQFEVDFFAPLSCRLPTHNQILALTSFLGSSAYYLKQSVANSTAVMLRSLCAPLLQLWIYQILLHQAAGSRVSAEDACIQWGFHNTYSRNHTASTFQIAFLCTIIPLRSLFLIAPSQEKSFHL